MHVIVGSGAIGSTIARLLAARGERSRVITRSGTGPDHALVEKVAADAADRAALIELTRGAEVIYNCANPPYTDWQAKWPPLNAAMVAAAKANDAVYAITGNLYGYGPQPDGRMNEHTPLAAVGRKGKVRIAMWQHALDAGIRTVELRGSDYLGPGARGVHAMVIAPALAKGRAAWVPGDPDLPHSWTYVGDMARGLVELARDERAWGRAWHVPSPTLTIRELMTRYAKASGKPEIPLRKLPRPAMRTAGLAVPMARELAEMDYQFYAPFHLDASETTRTFGLTATDIDTAVREEVSGG